jgi:hypothetical protein
MLGLPQVAPFDGIILAAAGAGCGRGRNVDAVGVGRSITGATRVSVLQADRMPRLRVNRAKRGVSFILSIIL